MALARKNYLTRLKSNLVVGAKFSHALTFHKSEDILYIPEFSMKRKQNYKYSKKNINLLRHIVLPQRLVDLKGVSPILVKCTLELNKTLDVKPEVSNALVTATFNLLVNGK